MREILFRGKRLDNGDWVEGYLYEHEPPLVGIVSENDALEPSKWFIARTGFADWNMPRPVELVKVDPSTVGQYTGLTDKNGKRIFEGDIIDCWSEGVNAKGTVQQRIDGLWIIHPAWQNHIVWGICPDKFGNTTVEIIGNIHDNPEMLKEGANNG